MRINVFLIVLIGFFFVGFVGAVSVGTSTSGLTEGRVVYNPEPMKFNNATALVVAIAQCQQTAPDIQNIKDAAEQLVDYIYNGNTPF